MGVIVGIICALFLWETQTMGVYGGDAEFSENLFKKNQALPIETIFKLPSATPIWPPGGNFANGIIDLGGLLVSQISAFNKVWASHEGGPDNQGATLFEPTGIPQGFFMLGSYSQPNNKPLFGWVLVAKDVCSSTTKATLKQPLDYTLVWSSASLKINQDSHAYIWLPTPPDGYKSVGHVVTTTPNKPSLDKIRCVRSDLTEQCETYSWIWGSNGFNVFDVRPSNRGTQASGVRVGAFVAQNGGSTSPLSISCLKNINANTKPMPNLQQIEEIVKAYSPSIYLHPDEEYLPSSVNWFFSNGALLYKKGQESKPVPIAPNGTNLPQGGNNDGAYWLDLPAENANKERVKKGDLPSSKAYIHVKPMLGGTFTDIAMWVFYPFNGPARAKVKFINTIKLGRMGEHVGDWEHVTIRVSNFNGELWEVYFSQHNRGSWIEASQIEFQSANKPVVYSSLHSHASYPHAGLNLLGNEGNGIGIRDDSGKSGLVMDMVAFELVSAEYLGSEVIGPPWLNFFSAWGPKIDYDIDNELKNVEKILLGKLKRQFDNIVRGLPSEVLGEEGPTGPKVKNNWGGDEV
ncbi:putative vacuolar protein sorting-associated protein [Lupinus albus]|uniref:Putative vacuolar protein sorting-associated protein n=1 Tax=Lupinus albus TaxID=3870 RepID=A0A6A4R5X6_LUPAL|nr:putative vacuolar protein sorting-associated protein [Lupinus albus]